MSIVIQIKKELNQLGIKPKKSLGQNFLINEGVYKKIVTALELKPGETVVEVGPGLGTLTKFLLDAGARVIAIEKDRHLAEYLKTKFANTKNVKIVEGDILKFFPSDYSLPTTRYKLVGNIPYYLTSRLLRTVFEKWPQPELIVLMLQKEVAKRIKAKPPKMSVLAVSVQYYAKPEIVSYVSSGSFYPPPDIDSAIIKLTPRSVADSPAFQKRFFEIVKMSFAGKRKQLINNLSRGIKLAKEKVQQKLASIGIDSRRRAETLSIEEWEKITNIFYSPR